jgi:hypothetical protein
MPGMTRLEATSRKARRRTSEHRRRPKRDATAGLSNGAAAAQRASAGMGTEDLEPTDWLFGDTLGKAGS